jgi:dolichol-phosphate mannosyltransferase
MVPTYNERDNVEWLFDGIRSLGLPLDVLFVDDNSPDGTGDVLDSMAAKHPEIRVLHRPGKAGIGRAHKVGIHKAYEMGYRTLITMDADLTHSPHDIPKFLEQSGSNDVVVGSRHLMKDSLAGWSVIRRVLTHVGKLLTTHMLGIREDATGAFRVYRLDVIPPALFDSVNSDSYSFFFESLYVLNRNGFSIREVPIALPPRTYGSSKMNLRDILISIKTLLVIFIQGRFTKRQFGPRRRTEIGKGL